jgi:phenylacetate-CoA ligase
MSTLSGIAFVASVLRVQYRSREALDRAITAGVQQTLRYARDVVPAYADERYDVPPMAGLDDLARLPLLRKADVLAAGVTPYHAPGYTRDNVQIYTTSGTTGLILEVWHDAGNYGHDRACNIRRFFATGRYRPWSRLVHFKPFPLDTSWYQRLGIFRREVVNSALPVRTRCERLLAARTHAIIGYPIMLRDLLRGLTDDELAPTAAHPEGRVHRVRVVDRTGTQAARRRVRRTGVQRVLGLPGPAHRVRLYRGAAAHRRGPLLRGNR